VHPVSLAITSVTWTSMVGLVLGCFTLGLTQWLWTTLEKRYFPVGEEVRRDVRHKVARHV